MFNSKAEIDTYLSGETVECLECGKHFRNVGLHCVYKHQMSAEEYKIRHGIPMYRGLVGSATRKVQSEKTTARIRAGEISISPAHVENRIHPEKFAAAVKNAVKKPEYQQRKFFEAAAIAREENKYQPWVFEEFLKRLESGRLLQEVEKDEDMPCSEIIYRHAKKNKEYKIRLRASTSANLKAHLRALRTKVTKDMAYEFLARMKLGRYARDVAKDDDMPSTAALWRYMQIDSEFAVNYNRHTQGGK